MVIRTKNDKAGLEKILKSVENQRRSYQGRIDVVVVDTESSDGTLDVAKDFGAAVVNIRQQDFNYPRSINLGLKQAKADSEVGFITVGHAQPVLNIYLKAGGRHFRDSKVAGVYSIALPNKNASLWEKTVFPIGNLASGKLRVGAKPVKKVHMGVMQAIACMVRIQTWQDRPFDESYAHGGEDSAWGRSVLKAGWKIVYEPAMAVHHTHGLGMINFLRQFRQWLHMYKNTGKFNQRKLAKYRPDLFGE